MGAIASLIGFLIVFPCFLIGFTKVVKTILRWRRDAYEYYDYADWDDED